MLVPGSFRTSLDISYPDVKPGIAEEITAMLTDDKDLGLITLEKASQPCL